jgi:hypothetical protein
MFSAGRIKCKNQQISRPIYNQNIASRLYTRIKWKKYFQSLLKILFLNYPLQIFRKVTMNLLLSLWVCINPKAVRTGRVSWCNIKTTSNDKQTVSKIPCACSVELVLIVHVLIVWYPFKFTVSSHRYVNLRVYNRGSNPTLQFRYFQTSWNISYNFLFYLAYKICS